MRRDKELAKFIRDYSDRGFRFAYQLSGNAEDAKELVQEAFFRVIRNWAKWDATSNPESWFLTILRNVYYDALRRYERRNSLSLDRVFDEDGESQNSLSDMVSDVREESFFESLVRQERSGMVRGVLDSLNPEHKAVLVLCDMEGLSYEKISVVLDCPMGTVRSRISRAREAFREKFEHSFREVMEP
ncbi:MAG: RNA polymerase sigma factor [Elusimicrobiota bacterium]